MGQLIAKLLRWVQMNKPLLAAVSIGELVDQAQELMGGAQTGRELTIANDAARAVAHILDDPDCLHPVNRNGLHRGEPIVPTHHVVDIVGAKCWFTAHYYTKGMVDAAYKKGRAAGIRIGTRQAQQAVEAAT